MYMFFGDRRCKCDNRTVMVNGAELHRVNATVHLGHHMSTNDNDSLVSAAIEQYWRGFNMFMADNSQIHSHIKCHLFKLYCCSYYGAPWMIVMAESGGSCAPISSVESRSCFVQTHEVNMW